MATRSSATRASALALLDYFDAALGQEDAGIFPFSGGEIVHHHLGILSI